MTPIGTENLTQIDFDWLWGCYSYGNVSTITATARLLTIFRNHIIFDGPVHINTDRFDELATTASQFDDWVYKVFPDYLEYSLYPMIDAGMTLKSYRAKKVGAEISDLLRRLEKDGGSD